MRTHNRPNDDLLTKTGFYVQDKKKEPSHPIKLHKIVQKIM
jgi:hypothetical protein